MFVDDILIYSKTAEEHAELVEWVLRRLQEEGYVAHQDKTLNSSNGRYPSLAT